MTPEGKVKKECRAYLKSIGAYVFSPVQTGYGAATVDDLVCFRGRFVAIEYKRSDKFGKLTDRQQRTISAIHAAWGYAFVATSVQDIVDAFDSYKLYKAQPFE